MCSLCRVLKERRSYPQDHSEIGSSAPPRMVNSDGCGGGPTLACCPRAELLRTNGDASDKELPLLWLKANELRASEPAAAANANPVFNYFLPKMSPNS